jgi:CubicO group peptidase (beta-lactamase class C family)
MNACNSEDVGLSQDRLQQINKVMQRYVDEKKMAGIVTLVARQNRLAHCAEFGLADIETKRPVAFDTIFRVYSMTKPITSVALMMLVEQGQVRLADPVTRFIPEFKKLKVLDQDGNMVDLNRAITVYDLLTHTAGLSYGEYEEGVFETVLDEIQLYRAELSSKEFIRRLLDIPLINQPGERWYYSSATDVVGYLVELISDTPLADFFEHEIFAPLNMIDTGFIVPVDKADRLATLYETDGSGSLTAASNEPDSDYSERTRLHTGGHGLVSTATDYLRFAQMVLNNGELEGVQILKPASVELMTRNHLSASMLPMHFNGIVDRPAPGIGFGLGFNVIIDISSSGTMGYVGDYGWGGNAESYFWVSPQEKIIAILMTQCMPSMTYPIRNDFRTLVYQALVG